MRRRAAPGGSRYISSMAQASLRLIEALRETAARLERTSTVYRWSQLAHCNCGHLAQTITGLPPSAIGQAAARHRGDWAEQARTHHDYGDRPALDEGAWEPEDLLACPVAERSMSTIFAELVAAGLEARDIGAFERLDDPAVRRRLGTSTTDFLHSDRKNVVAYLLAWAELLEEELERGRRVRPGAPARRSTPWDEALGTPELPVAAE
jgi:hypothetical protein